MRYASGQATLHEPLISRDGFETVFAVRSLLVLDAVFTPIAALLMNTYSGRRSRQVRKSFPPSGPHHFQTVTGALAKLVPAE
jgi:hypothetical protein